MDPRWRIIYSVACTMRSRISDTVICAESVSDFIAFNNLDREFQDAVDSSKTLNWRSWPEHTDTSLAYGPTTRPLEYCLQELYELYLQRQDDKVYSQAKERIISRQEAIKRLQENEDLLHQSNGSTPLRPVIAFADSPPDNSQTLLANRFLCREGGMLFVGPSGIGKTAASVQQDILWSIGRPAFGIAPTRPLKILTIQAEDDEGDLSEIVSGILSHLNLTPDHIALSRQNCLYVSEKSLTGLPFLEKIVAPLLIKTQPDLLRINPLQAYLGGDIKDSQLTAAFLRNTLNPLLTLYRLATIIVHHTPKTNFRDTSEWKASDWMYAGAGAADITNWARAALVIDPTDNPDVFRFIAAKRGSRIGWASEEGDTVTIRHFSHSQSSAIFWQETEQINIPDPILKKTGRQKKVDPSAILSFMSAIDPVSTDTVRNFAYKELNIPRSTFFRHWEKLQETKQIIQINGKWIRT